MLLLPTRKKKSLSIEEAPHWLAEFDGNFKPFYFWHNQAKCKQLIRSWPTHKSIFCSCKGDSSISERPHCGYIIQVECGLMEIIKINCFRKCQIIWLLLVFLLEWIILLAFNKHYFPEPRIQNRMSTQRGSSMQNSHDDLEKAEISFLDQSTTPTQYDMRMDWKQSKET